MIGKDSFLCSQALPKGSKLRGSYLSLIEVSLRGSTVRCHWMRTNHYLGSGLLYLSRLPLTNVNRVNRIG